MQARSARKDSKGSFHREPCGAREAPRLATLVMEVREICYGHRERERGLHGKTVY